MDRRNYPQYYAGLTLTLKVTGFILHAVKTTCRKFVYGEALA